MKSKLQFENKRKKTRNLTSQIISNNSVTILFIMRNKEDYDRSKIY